jgi:hypothetical protein
VTTQPHNWQDLTPIALLRFARRWTVQSWLFIIGALIAIVCASWSAGYAYRAGALPEVAYALEESESSPRTERLHRERIDGFSQSYGNLMDWQTLRAIASSIAKDKPDGLSSDFEIVASLLAQVRGTRGEAHFLAGEKDHVLTIIRGDGAFNFEWDVSDSIVRRIAKDAGYELTDEQLQVANSNLNWAQFTYLDDAMKHAVIYRDIDGTLALVLVQD